MIEPDKARQIRHVLTQIWNPIELTLPETDDEYDKYVPIFYSADSGKHQNFMTI